MSYYRLTFLFMMISLFSSVFADTISELDDKKLLSIPADNDKVIKEYLKNHKDFFKEVCPSGTEPKFWELVRNYNRFGHFVPRTIKNKLDQATVNRLIPEIQSKKEWIEKQMSYLEGLSQKQLKKRRELIDDLQEKLDILLEEKKKAFLGETKKGRNKAKIRSKYKFIQYRHDWNSFAKKISFLLSYNYPVDHFDLRFSYDRYKKSEKPKEKRKANEIYFYRKIVQDGATNKNGGRSDRFLRTAVDTVGLELQKSYDLIPDELRYDLEYVLPTLDRQLSYGKRNLIDRLENWKKRTERALDFYKSLKENKVKVDDHYETGEQIIKALSKSREELRNFSFEKQAETYNYWKGESELMRALFVLETILYNEVADLDGPEALERQDVSQVVINRTRLQRYSSIIPSEPFHRYLSKQDKLLSKYTWLNTLFKEGEFSFTYYFIHGNIRIYCPEMTRRGKKLRRNNLKIALQRLRKPNFDFEAIRYFSRHSMLGRIDMAQIWTGFEPIQERPGPRITKDKVLKNLHKDNLYQFLYRFTSPEGKVYHVLRMEKANQEYVYHPSTNRFYKYRNPHFFRYFKPE